MRFGRNMTSQRPDADHASPPAGVLRQMLARRQAEAARDLPPDLPRPGPSTPARAAALALGRVAERLHGLPVQPLEVTAGALTLSELVELLPERPLLGVLQGPGEMLGAIALCPDAATALVEAQTLGRVTARVMDRRRPTRSEAMLCADFINALLAELQSDLAGMPGFEPLGRFRFAASVDEARSLALLLDHDAFRSLDFRLRLGGPTATRDGRILLALPQTAAQKPAAPPNPAPDPAPALAPPAGVADSGAAPDLSAAMREASIEVVAVLCRRRLSLRELRGLTAGRLLTLPKARLTDARVETADGQLLARGRLGEAGGCHAIRLSDPSEMAETAPDAGALSLARPVMAAQQDDPLPQPGFGDLPDLGGPELAPFLPPLDLSDADPFCPTPLTLEEPDMPLDGGFDRAAG